MILLAAACTICDQSFTIATALAIRFPHPPLEPGSGEAADEAFACHGAGVLRWGWCEALDDDLTEQERRIRHRAEHGRFGLILRSGDVQAP